VIEGQGCDPASHAATQRVSHGISADDIDTTIGTRCMNETSSAATLLQNGVTFIGRSVMLEFRDTGFPRTKCAGFHSETRDTDSNRRAILGRRLITDARLSDPVVCHIVAERCRGCSTHVSGKPYHAIWCLLLITRISR
jgi:hypothetical protein